MLQGNCLFLPTATTEATYHTIYLTYKEKILSQWGPPTLPELSIQQDDHPSFGQDTREVKQKERRLLAITLYRQGLVLIANTACQVLSCRFPSCVFVFVDSYWRCTKLSFVFRLQGIGRWEGSGGVIKESKRKYKGAARVVEGFFPEL